MIAWAVLAFVGLAPAGAGVTQTWGEMIGRAYQGLGMLTGAYWWFVPPLLCIVVAALGPILLSLRMRRIYDEAPRVAMPVEPPTPVAPTTSPGPNP